MTPCAGEMATIYSMEELELTLWRAAKEMIYT